MEVGLRTLLLNARRVIDPQRRSERILLAFEDISERRRAQKTSAHLAAIVASSEDAIYSIDLTGLVVS